VAAPAQTLSSATGAAAVIRISPTACPYPAVTDTMPVISQNKAKLPIASGFIR
jgi:hypothetical protein